MKLLVLDGNSIANRAFYGIKLLSTQCGQYTNAIYGFINILNSLIEKEDPDGVAIAFDLRAPTFRHKIYDEYKAGRKPMPQELATQFPVLKELLTLLGHHCIEIEGYEADDILGTLSLAAEKTDDICVISTGDRDSLQLVSDHTKVLLAATRAGRPEIIEYTPKTLFEQYGLTPSEMIELKALMGDASDHIPGVPGVGEKTATDLVKRFHCIEYIYDNLDTLDVKEGVRNKLASGKESAFLSKKLGTIFREVPISLNFEDYRFAKTDKNLLADMLRKLEFYKLLEKMGLQNYGGDTEESSSLPVPSYNIVNYEKFLNILKEHKHVTVLQEQSDLYFACTDALLKLNIELNENEIKNIFAAKNLKIRAVDSKNLYKIVGGITDIPIVDFDLSLAGYLCSATANSYEVERLASEYLKSIPVVENCGNNSYISTAIANELCPVLLKEVEKCNMQSLLNDIELPLAKTLSEMETEGFLLDAHGVKEMGERLEKRIESLEKEICELAGETFNIKSPLQLGNVLFENLGLKHGKKTQRGYSTTAEILEKIKNDHPIVPKILEYRSITKLHSTYCEGLLKAVSNDGRVHSTFNQTETRTGRISSLEPNLQNIPVRSEEGRELRKFFISKPGYVLLDSDYSQIELRVLAHMAGDKAMISAFNNGEDIHTKTAGEVFDMPPLLVTPKMRSSAKAVNFGIIYGIGAFSLAQDIGVSRAEAARYIEGYFATYPQIRQYMEDIVESAKEKGYAETMFGRRRYLPELKSSNGNIRAFGERVARNMPIQGTAADIIKLAMVKTRQRFLDKNLDARVILQVHDELIVEAEESIANEASEILEYEMEHAVKLAVPLIAEVHKAKSWYSAKE